MFRSFLFLLLLFSALASGQEAPPLTGKSVVYAARNPQAIARFDEDPAAVKALVDRLATAVTQQSSPAAAWRALVKPEDRVLIQTAGEEFFARKAVIDAVRNGVQSVGVRPEAIIVSSGPHSKADYDASAAVSIPIAGKLIDGDLLFAPGREDILSPLSHWTKVTGSCTKIINLPVFSSSESCGIAGAVFNVSVRNVDNWRRFVARPAFGDPYIAMLYANKRLHGKVALTIMDGLIAQYAGEPGFEPGYSIHHATLYASRDPFAVDAVALRQIEAWRAEAKLPPLAPRGGYLRAGEAMGLGVASEESIELRTLP